MSDELKPVAENLEPKKVTSLDEKIREQQERFKAAKNSQLEGQINELKARLEGMDAAMQQVVNGVNNQATTLMEQILALEQTLISISKITTALSQALIKKTLLTDADVMTELRLTEDKLEKSRTEEMLQLGMIELISKSTDASILVVKQERILEDGSKSIVSNYRTVQIGNMNVDDPLRAELIGKQAGDIVATSKDGESFAFTIQSIYGLVEQKKLEPEA